MKRQLAVILALFCMGALCWGQGTTAPFDLKKSREEIEIMRGIIRTTLSFAAQDSRRQASSSLGFSGIQAFYLAGQGAVFVIPRSSLRISLSPVDTAIDLGPDFYQEIEDMTREVEANAKEIARQAAEVARLNARRIQQEEGNQATAAAPAPPAPPAPPQPPKALKREALRELTEEYRKRARQSQEELKVNHEKYIKNLAETKDLLIETLANYGDSMTTVKPGEYINLVLVTNDFGGEITSDWSRQRIRHDVISAQKSWIADYRAGKLTLDAFKAKLIQYID